MLFAQQFQGIYRTPAEQTKISGISRNFYLAQRLYRSIKGFCGHLFDERLPFPQRAARVDDIKPFLPSGDQFRNKF